MTRSQNSSLETKKTDFAEYILETLMATFSEFDAEMMAKALRLAEQATFLARPNPRVGCVITQQNKIIGQGFHQCYGQAHAEINALNQARAAGHDVAGATAYVTLEPCSHTGQTGPCSQALIDAGVAEVVVAMSDPNPQVNGRGINQLQQAGITVRTGLMADSAAKLNQGFIKRMQTGRPWVTVKLAASVDGRTAMASGESKWITGPAARLDVQRLRARHDAIITGSGTVLADHPSLNVRFADWSTDDAPATLQQFRQPLRVVIDRQGALPIDNSLFAIDSPIWWVGTNEVATSLPSHIERKVFSENGLFDELLQQLALHPCNDVLLEAGAELAGQFVSAGLVDELVVYRASSLMGSQARPLVELPLDKMADKLELSQVEQRMVGQDCRTTYRIIKQINT
ncbi:MAG: bifunctional diaminohydroxyphosphoribosylaminopyrimidine deaminase/5-amino-6-(5-phosphoribosylamino)uracil reductase RibD [Kangiellaceae bacterium]|nr:bifunctional diaminohydroxyphosphoribosylaminopyrimidine deaminase/5-amino-6-(5-phosphoribosylamino)uracil reductase RibD [Kangiellaceae bacterium]